MKDVQSVFSRYEKKYLLSQMQYYLLMEELKDKIQPDQYQKSTICNIYYDTRDFHLIQTSLKKPVYKEKLRLRSYNIPNEDSTVFLEIKKKYEGIVYKRRIPLPLFEAEKYLSEGEKPNRDSQILRELDWFLHFYPLEPKVFIAYERLAYVCKEDKELRITFDQHLRWREENLKLSSGAQGNPLLPASFHLMEIKILHALPLWMSLLFSKLKIYPTSYSKYGSYYQNIILNPQIKKEKIDCA